MTSLVLHHATRHASRLCVVGVAAFALLAPGWRAELIAQTYYLAIAGGDQQQGDTLKALPVPLSIRVTTLSGAAGDGVRGTFAITGVPAQAQGASLSAAAPTTTVTATTGLNGVAAVPLILGNQPGVYQVTATCQAVQCIPTSVIFAATAVKQPTLKSLSLAVNEIVGSNDATGTTTLRVELEDAAPAGGVSVNVLVEPFWDGPGVVRAADLTNPVVIPEGSASVDVDVRTIAVDFPIVVRFQTFLRAGKAADLTVLPPPNPSFFEEDERVARIVNHFLQGQSPADYAAALNQLVFLRNQNSWTSTDVSLAAAEHYFYAAKLVFEAPDSVFLAQAKGKAAVVFHEAAKSLGFNLQTTDLPQSPPGILTYFWGMAGVEDALKIRFGADNVVGGAPGRPQLP